MLCVRNMQAQRSLMRSHLFFVSDRLRPGRAKMAKWELLIWPCYTHVSPVNCICCMRMCLWAIIKIEQIRKVITYVLRRRFVLCFSVASQSLTCSGTSVAHTQHSINVQASPPSSMVAITNQANK